MSKRKLNIKLLKRLRTRFLRMRHPEHLEMTAWASKNECGTALCIGGHALQLQGYKIRFDEYEEGEFYSPQGCRVNPQVAAKRELGLTKTQARSLFFDFRIKTPKDAVVRIGELMED